MAVAVTQRELKAQLDKLLAELKRRRDISKKVRRYIDGEPPFPEAVVRAQMTRAYRLLMPMAGAPWGSLVVDSSQDRLEVAGLRAADDVDVDPVWDAWQGNDMDAESKLGHNAALTDGRVFATVWPGDDGQPEITLDGCDQMIIMYREGKRSHRHRLAALRHWVEDDDTQHATLYRPEAIYKYSEARTQSRAAGRIFADDTWWEPRIVDTEPWPLPNPLGVLPNVEVPVNRRVGPGEFPYARGEFQHCIGMLDRINLLTFLGLIVALWMGFPLRGVIGEKILRDDKGDPLPPFDANADSLFQLEDKDAKLASFEAADRKNLSVVTELTQLAYITKTPAHYFPHESLANISADAIRGLEGGLHAKVTGHKATLGSGWREVNRLVGLMLDKPVLLPPTTQVLWKDHEYRSMGERADAASKLQAGGMPWAIIAEKFLNFSQDEIERAGQLMTLVRAAQTPEPTPPAPAPAGA